ncbi:unnamed protein product [Gadus morhua 'NCC']
MTASPGAGRRYPTDADGLYPVVTSREEKTLPSLQPGEYGGSISLGSASLVVESSREGDGARRHRGTMFTSALLQHR